VSDVWDLYGQLAEQDPASLSPEQRALVAVCDLRQEVNAGGFDNYFRAWGGDSAEDALAALPHLLGQQRADLLRSAMAFLGPAYPSDPDERGDMLDQLDLDDRLDELDQRFYALEGETDADSRLNAYLDASPW
jgi:Domain of unknown function (DUF4375)